MERMEEPVNRNMKWMAHVRGMLAPDAGGETVQAMDDTQREEGLRRREAEICRREMRAQAVELLSSEQMPTELADLLDYSDVERFASSMDRLKRGFKQAVQRGVETRVAASAPKVRAGSRSAASLKQAIASHYRLP